MLYELVYNSVAVPLDLPDIALEHILAGARRQNREAGVTGLLLFHGGDFVQLLEGTREAVGHIYHDIIVHDRRHRAVNLCWQQAVETRSFTGWSMGYTSPAALDPAQTPHLEGFLAGGVAALDLSGPASKGRFLLMSIYAQMKSAAPWNDP